MNSSSGMVYWITGLSGSGKTTIGKLFSEKLKAKGVPLVFLDGDNLRDVFDNNLGHTPEDRLILAKRYARLCKMIADQGIDVVCATISMFNEVRTWNRRHIANYIEIYLRVPMEILKERDRKGIYTRALCGEIKNVMGIDLPVEEPEEPDILIEYKTDASPDEIANYLSSIIDTKKANE